MQAAFYKGCLFIARHSIQTCEKLLMSACHFSLSLNTEPHIDV